MTVCRRLIAGIGLCCIAAGPLHAQDYLLPRDGDPLATDKVPNTTVVGQTKPPSRDASPTSVKAIDRPTPRQAADDAITARICRGCKSDPVTTGSVEPATPPDSAAARDDVKLEELRTVRTPQKQSDLDTVELASAHREQAKSMEEKTTGLWQSWLVSVCEGCGNQLPARALRLEDWPNRDAPATTGSVERKATADGPRPAPAAKPERPVHGSLEADLSPENVDSIRRMPQR